MRRPRVGIDRYILRPRDQSAVVRTTRNGRSSSRGGVGGRPGRGGTSGRDGASGGRAQLGRELPNDHQDYIRPAHAGERCRPGRRGEVLDPPGAVSAAHSSSARHRIRRPARLRRHRAVGAFAQCESGDRSARRRRSVSSVGWTAHLPMCRWRQAPAATSGAGTERATRQAVTTPTVAVPGFTARDRASRPRPRSRGPTASRVAQRWGNPGRQRSGPGRREAAWRSDSWAHRSCGP